MSPRARPFVFCLFILFSALAFNEATHEACVKSATFLSPPFSLNPGSVLNKYYFDIPFPRGHIALKSFQGEVVDENGVPVPLHETYLHHWVVDRYYYKKGSMIPRETTASKINISDITLVGNSGVCKHALRQYFGLGSETRKTDTWVPDPYGIVVGNPQEIPDGYEEGWLLTVHAIDTRGVEDRLGCTECKCSLYNSTKDEYGRSIPKDYIGGLYCCYDQTQCPVKRGFEGARRKLYLRYTVKWVDYDQSVLPVKIYILDVTDTGMSIATTDGKTKGNRRLNCKVMQLCSALPFMIRM